MILTVTLNPTVDKNYEVAKLTPGDVIRVKKSAQTPGGKGIQVAKAARLLGEKVTAAGFIGGHNGNYIKSFLENAGIQTCFTEVPGETRICINVHDDSTGRITELLEPGTEIRAEDRESLLEHFEAGLEGCEIVAVCGSVPAGIDDSFYPELIKLAKKAGKKVILDTSGNLLKAGVEACPDVIKPNRDELRELTGKELKDIDDVVSAATELKDKGIETVIVSLGKDGAVFVTGNEAWQGTTPDIPIVNTVGCGDSLVAGFATGMRRGMALPDSIRLAMAVSTANALRPETGFFLQEDLERLLKMVEAVKL